MLINHEGCLHQKQTPFEFSYIEIIEGEKVRITKREQVCLTCHKTVSSSVTRTPIVKGNDNETS